MSNSRGLNKSCHTFTNTTSGHSRQVQKTALAALTRNQPWQTWPQFRTQCAVPKGTFGNLYKRDFLMFFFFFNPSWGKWLEAACGTRASRLSCVSNEEVRNVAPWSGSRPATTLGFKGANAFLCPSPQKANWPPTTNQKLPCMSVHEGGSTLFLFTPSLYSVLPTFLVRKVAIGCPKCC